MKRLWLLAVLTALGAAGDAPEAQLMLPGGNWKDNVPTQSGEKWLALQNGPGVSALSTVTVVVTKKATDDMQPLVVSIKENFSPVFLVRGVRGLSPGPARTVFQGLLALNWYDGASFYELGPAQREVSIDAGPAETKYLSHGERAQRGYHLVLTSHQENLRQYIIVLRGRPARVPRLRWAGDLDHDGRIDVLLDAQTVESEGGTYQLWLSSGAKHGELVGLVATLRVPDL